MMTTSAAPAAVPLARPLAAAEPHRHGHRHDHDHDHGDHADGRGHGVAQGRHGGPIGVSLLRASLGLRLTIAGALSALIWLAVAWARLPIAG
ncbi:MAG: hypothetical protein LWW93_17675 [Hyphomicrobiales bacterium]|nr:hypothetical protein [Hyphomicrobiales bacterium]